MQAICLSELKNTSTREDLVPLSDSISNDGAMDQVALQAVATARAGSCAVVPDEC
jgi:delta-aminolevulinic acid dehydratase/porphobilinogen synthase